MSNSNPADNSDLPWYDWPPDGNQSGFIPVEAECVRIGFVEYQQLLQGKAVEPLAVPQQAFSQRMHLKQVQIYLPSVSRIGEWAFWNCRRLERVEFLVKPQDEEDKDNAPPSQLVSIGQAAFQHDSLLHSVLGLEHAKESLQKIGDFIFLGCIALANIDYLRNVTRLNLLGKTSFCGAVMTRVDLSKAIHLTVLRDRTFWKCSHLTNVRLPPNLLEIGHLSFSDCLALEELHLPAKLQVLGPGAFLGCLVLRAITLPPSVREIGDACFQKCRKLSQVRLPMPGLPFLKLSPFDCECTSLSSLELPTPVPRKQWPIILEYFCQEHDETADSRGRIDRERDNSVGGIRRAKNRNSVVWNFLRRNMAQLFIDDVMNTEAMTRRRYRNEAKVPVEKAGENKAGTVQPFHSKTGICSHDDDETDIGDLRDGVKKPAKASSPISARVEGPPKEAALKVSDAARKLLALLGDTEHEKKFRVALNEYLAANDPPPAAANASSASQVEQGREADTESSGRNTKSLERRIDESIGQAHGDSQQEPQAKRRATTTRSVSSSTSKGHAEAREKLKKPPPEPVKKSPAFSAKTKRKIAESSPPNVEMSEREAEASVKKPARTQSGGSSPPSSQLNTRRPRRSKRRKQRGTL